ncbi:MAG TPA: NAD(P)H-dependent oxidoreductase [Bdellovibrionota bacterium]|jgi:nitroreductase|nr:NAD(P)H-dependent oxidoreductase [Bdellovibrionota bacterium]
MPKISTQELLNTQKWRYATKRFDAAKKIPAETWSALEDTLVLTPSSYGLQPWKFLVVNSADLRAQLRAKSWNQSQVEEASHYVVFAALRNMSEAHIDVYMSRTAAVREVPLDSLAGFKRAIMGDAVNGPRAKIAPEWNARQCYIALGNLMTSAALLGIDTCPMEGLDPLAYDKILGLEGSPYQTIMACALGYRHVEDKYASTPKVRFDKSQLVEHL